MRRRLVRGLLVGVPIGLVVLVVGAYLAVALSRKAPPLRFQALTLPVASARAGQPRIPWPTVGEAAVEVQGIGELGKSGSQHPVPIASVAKVMTALLVLRDHPLPAGAQGPDIPVSGSDAAVYRADRATGQSVVRVTARETLTERQALEGLLLPSANNFASLLADWDAGSQVAFVARMNALARALGLTATRYADASGFDPSTVSTAQDQARLALVALARPSFRQIVAMPQVQLPVAGLVANRDDLLGRMGIIGVKTGNTLAAGGCFVFATRQFIGGRRVTVAGAVLHQPLTPTASTVLDGAFSATTALLRSLPHVLHPVYFLARRGLVGSVTAPWGRRVQVRPGTSAVLLRWAGLAVHVRVLPTPRLRAPLRTGQAVGRVLVQAGGQRVSLVLTVSGALPGPSLGWRLTHP